MVAETMPATSDAVPLLGKINCSWSCYMLFCVSDSANPKVQSFGHTDVRCRWALGWI